MKAALVVLLLLLLPSCTFTSSVEPAKLSGIRSVRVLSAVGDTVTLKAVGFTVFGNDTRAVPAASWGIDDAVTERVAALLGRRFEVLPAKVDHAAFSGRAGAAPIGPLASTPPFLETLRGLAADQPADAWIVLLPATKGLYGMNQSISGLGLLQTHPIFTYKYTLHAVYSMWVVDGRDFSVLGSTLAPATGSIFTPGGEVPTRSVDESWWPDPIDAMTPSQADKLAHGLKQLMADSVPVTMRALNIAQ